MDRLSAVILVLFAACKEDPGPPPTQRTEKVTTSANKQKSADEFCDLHNKDDSGAALTFPALTGTPPPAAADGHWRWVNLWATWCKPCIEELPRLQRWKTKLDAAGHPIDLVFVSVDENDADIAKYRSEHPGTPESARLADPKNQDAWVAALGLTAGSIPIHVFVSPKGHVRCARAAGVQEQDFGAIEKLLAE
jgi:thiol-disulfide isomerase/thioredoxin